MSKEEGAASVHIELSEGNITVFHGTDGVILHKAENVPAGSWDRLWDAIKSL